MTKRILAAMAVLLVAAAAAQNTTPDARPRASDLGLKVGILPTGPLDAITDVAGVEVGQKTIIRGGDVRTGVTGHFLSRRPAGFLGEQHLPVPD